MGTLKKKVLSQVTEPQSPISNVIDDDLAEEDNVTEGFIHTLPFKFLGTCQSVERQKALEEAYEYLHDHNRPVLVKLKPEPENKNDKNVMAVYIMSWDDYSLFGFIPRELTCYVQPVLGEPEFEVNVRSIRFRTTFLLIGLFREKECGTIRLLKLVGKSSNTCMNCQQ